MSKINQSESGYGTYILGFVLSLALTLEAYYLVVQHRFVGWTLAGVLAVFALMQLIVQLYFFLHLGRGRESRWNLLVFACMALVVVILVGGSLWIMINLDYHHPHALPPDQLKDYLHTHEGL